MKKIFVIGICILVMVTLFIWRSFQWSTLIVYGKRMNTVREQLHIPVIESSMTPDLVFRSGGDNLEWGLIDGPGYSWHFRKILYVFNSTLISEEDSYQINQYLFTHYFFWKDSSRTCYLRNMEDQEPFSSQISCEECDSILSFVQDSEIHTIQRATKDGVSNRSDFRCFSESE